MIFDQIEFDETVGAVAKWAEDRDDTLIIVTTDHACANPGLTYYAESGNKSFDKLSNATRSFEWISREFRKSDKSIDSLASIIETATSIRLDENELATLGKAAFERQPIDAFDIANGTLVTLGALLANHTGVAFLSPNHTADYVEVTALGPGSEEMPAFIDNIHLHSMMLAAMDTRVPD